MSSLRICCSRGGPTSVEDLEVSVMLKDNIMQPLGVADSTSGSGLGALSQPCFILLTPISHSPLLPPSPLAHPTKFKQTTLPPCTSIVRSARQGPGTPMSNCGRMRKETKMRRRGRDESEGGE